MKEMKIPLIIISCFYFTKTFIVTRFVSPIQRYYNCHHEPETTNDNQELIDNDEMYKFFIEIELCTFLFSLGSLLGRIFTLFLKLQLKTSLIIVKKLLIQ